MAELSERRKYMRCTKAISRVQISIDNKNWTEVDVKDISAGGISFTLKNRMDADEKIFINISIYKAFTEFKMFFEGIVLKAESSGSSWLCRVRFINVNKYNQIHLDEIIKLKEFTGIGAETSYEDGDYAFIIPGLKKHKPLIYK